MSIKKRNRVAGWGDHVTSTVSVTLVLFILGLVGVINISFNGINRHLKEKMGFTVILSESVAPSTVDSLSVICSQAPYISEYKYMSADEVMEAETTGDGAELVELLGVNPYAPMMEIRLKADYADVDSVAVLMRRWEACDFVEEVTANTEMIGNLNRNARLLNMVLIMMAAALMLISFVLINNTVRLTVYSSRFLIHTMKLVGAKSSFIRAPFLKSNALEGLIAGVVASGLLAALAGWAHSSDLNLETLLPWSAMWGVFILVVVLGVAICVLAAYLATNRYLHRSYDDMFE